MATKPDTWMPLYIADYLRKTMHLTRDQHGGYMLLLMACWDRGGRLPNDPAQLAGIARATPAEWRKLAPVLLPFFDAEGEWLVQGRVVAEHEKAARLSEARRQSGLQGGRPRKPTETKPETEQKPIGFREPKPIETPTQVASPSPSTTPSESSVPDGTGGTPPDPVVAELEGLAVNVRSWRLAKRVLTERGGLTAKQASDLVAKWVNKDGLTVDDLWVIALATWRHGTTEAADYMGGAVRRTLQTGGEIVAPSADRQRAWISEYRDSPASWSGNRGPRPGQPGCRVSAEILAEFGFPAAGQNRTAA